MRGALQADGFGARCSCGACARGGREVARRRFVAAGTAALVVGALGSRSPRAQTTLGPDAAIAALMAGNARFAAGNLTSFSEDLAILKQGTVAKQEPFAAILSCADSRVPVEIAFDQSIGHVFVVRVAGNICDPQVIASLEYGAAALGTPAIMVLGHSGCGAVAATIGGKPQPGQITALYAPIQPAVTQAGPNLEAVIKANARIQAEILRTASPVLAGLVKEDKLKVVPAFYDLASGKVSVLEG